jgi:hypothetical protein
MNVENPFDFGIALHKYQDSFSHWQKLGEPDTAYEIWERHANNNIKWGDKVDEYKTEQNPDWVKIDCETENGMRTYIVDYVDRLFGLN